MEWTYEGQPITELPPEVVGFIYEITYTDGRKYIGKKTMTSRKTIPARKDGELRPNAERIQKRVKLTPEEIAELPASKKKQKTKLMPFDVVRSESNWRTYNGSSKETEGLTVESKRITHLCTTLMTLTYIEVEIMIEKEVLFKDEYLNKNILGKFYDNAYDGFYQEPVKEAPNLFSI